MKRAVLFALFASAMAMAQRPASVPRVTAAPIEDVTVKQGGSVPVEMQFRVAPGFHINSNKPKSELLLPTVVSLDVPTNVSVAKVTYPTGEELAFPFSPDEKLSVYTGDFTVKGLVFAAKSTPKGTYRVHGNLRYQACDNRACYPPTNIPLSFDVTVAKPTKSSSSTKKNPAQSPHVHK
jgi:DsbC/DsbD-like thiol-disulfide interchange protein